MTDLTAWKERRALLEEYQRELFAEFGENDYNVFVFGSYVRNDFRDGESDIDLIVYCENIIKRMDIAEFSRRFFDKQGLDQDVLEYYYMKDAYVYAVGILNSLPLTDYYPKQLRDELYVIAKNYAAYKKANTLRQKYQGWEYQIQRRRLMSGKQEKGAYHGKIAR